MTEPTIVDFFLDQKPSVELHDTMSGEKNLYPECYAAVTNDRVLIYSYRDGIHPQRPRASMPLVNLVVTHYGDHPAVRSVPDTPKPPESGHAAGRPQLPPQTQMHPQPSTPYQISEDSNADSEDFKVKKYAAEFQRPKELLEHDQQVPLSEQTLTMGRITEQINQDREPSFSSLPDSPPGSGSDQNGGESPSARQAAKQIVFSKDSDDSDEPLGGPENESEPERQPRGKQARIGGHRKVRKTKRAAMSLLAPVFLGFALLGRSYDMG